MTTAIKPNHAHAPAPKSITIYQTKSRIDNPVGDGRHNRAEWQSYLAKNFIPAGFVFGIDEEGNIHDRNVSQKVLPVSTPEAEKLREALMEVATAPLEAVDLSEPSPVEAMVQVLSSTLTPEQLIEAMQVALDRATTPNKPTPKPTAAAVKRLASAGSGADR